MKKWALLFDCDGVIVDSEPALAIISAAVLNRHGWPARPEDFAPFIGTGEDVYIGSVVRQYGGVFTESLKHEIYDSYIKEGLEYVKAFPAGLELIKALKAAGIPAVVASSADRIKVRANLAAVGLTQDDFVDVISGDQLERKKPWPDIYLLAAARAGVPPERCVVVEDAVAGVQAGKAGGMITVGFTSNCSRETLLEAGADYVFDHFEEISVLVETLSAVSLTL